MPMNQSGIETRPVSKRDARLRWNLALAPVRKRASRSANGQRALIRVARALIGIAWIGVERSKVLQNRP